MKIQKKFLIMFIVINITFCLIYLNKFESKADFISNMESDATDFITAGQNTAGDLDGVATEVTNNFSGLGQFLTMIGAGVMVAVVSYMGIQYIISPPDKQAALKQQLIGVVVAGIVIFGAYGIWKAILGIVSNF